MGKTGLKPTDELVRLAIIGDATAFTALWDTHIDGLRAYLRSSMKIRDDFFVDDICSRSFEKAFRQIKAYNPELSKFSTWLRTIAHNTALDTLASESRTGARTISLDLSSQPSQDEVDDVASPLETIINSENETNTRRSIDALPELYREIAKMRFLEDKPYKVIADSLGLELNTVRTRIRRAREMMERIQNEI